MARARMSETGMVELPRALRDAVGLVPGGEVEITESAGRLIVAPVPGVAPQDETERKRKLDAFLAMRIPYDGPPITDALIKEVLLDEAERRWVKIERQSNEDPID